MNYSYYYSSSLNDAASGAVIGILAGFGIAILLVAMIIAILQIIAMWKLFKKAGEAGWKSIIPIYNLVILYKVSGISPLWVLIYLAAAIPILGPLAILGVTIYQNYNLSKSFGKESAFTVGLVLLPTIFYMILGFGKAQYVGNTKTDVEVQE